MSFKSKLPEVDRTVTLPDIAVYAKKLDELMANLRESILAPRPRKNTPVFTSTQVAEMCAIDRSRLNYLATKGGAHPPGELQGNGRSRQFSLAEARKWVQLESKIPPSPLLSGKPGNAAVLLTANFKGGSTKTTTTMCLAQGLSLRGRKVLLIDMDPQASLTELCGFYAEKEISGDDTILPFIYEPEDVELSSAVQSTYWDGVDLIPAHPMLFDAEFHIPNMVSKQRSYRFWALLAKGLEPLRSQYDYIILDSAPSLSYLTLNALLATDAIVMPLVPESLDFVSSVSFWNLFSGLAQSFVELEKNKKYDFVSILLSKVDHSQNSSAPVVRSWAQQAYGEWLHTIEVPASSVMSNGALAIQTVFDISKWDGGNRTLQRIRAPLEEYCAWIDTFYDTRRV